MIVTPVRAKYAFADGRLDARYHCSPGVKAKEAMALLGASGIPFRRVAGPGGMGSVAPTSRTKRVYAAPGEDAMPYLRPYDVFDYLPQPADMLSISGSIGLDRLTPTRGTILQTCSGRNLGPQAYADDFVSKFVVSDDMLRLWIPNESERFYTLAFLGTPTGQALLTRSKTGNVIDHLSADDLSMVEVPFLSEETVSAIANAMREAVTLRSAARVRLAALIKGYEDSLPNPTDGPTRREGWTARASSLRSRFDAAFHDPHVWEVRSQLEALGGSAVGTLATASIPGRYKRYYVEPGHGVPIVSGRQLLQTKPINLRHIASRSFDFSDYALGRSMIAFGAEGRAEERVAQPVLITNDRSAWLANNHVMRVTATKGTHAGWLYLAFSTWQVQAQVKASARGSVVDSVTPPDLNRVILPPIDEARGEIAVSCWEDFEAANMIEASTVATLEEEIAVASGTAFL